MTYDEYNQVAQGLTAENAPVIIKNILENIKTDLDERDAFKASVEDKDSKIRDLQDTNMKLFLSQTSGKPNNDPEPELSGEDYVNALLKKVGAI